MFLGIDWGGTYIKAGLVDSRGKILRRRVYQSDALKKKEVFIETVKTLVDDFGAKKIKAIGIGAPGIVDINKGFIYYLPNISGWKDYPLKKVLRRDCAYLYI